MYHTVRTYINLVDVEDFGGASVNKELHSLAPTTLLLDDTGYTFKHTGNKLKTNRSSNGYYNLILGTAWTNTEFAFVPIFDELDIDVVLMGHDHVYCRTFIMDGLNPMTDVSVYDNPTYTSVTDPEGGAYVTVADAMWILYKSVGLDYGE